MGTLLAELLAFSLLLAIFQGCGVFWGYHAFLALHVLSGIWRLRPMTISSSLIGLVINIVAPFAGFVSMILALFVFNLGDFGGMLSAYLVAGFVYFSVYRGWNLVWKIGGTIALLLVMVVGYCWFLPLMGWNGFTSYMLFPILLSQVIELGFSLVQKIRPGTHSRKRRL